MNRPLDVMAAGLVVVDVLVRLPCKVRRGEKHEVADLLVTGGSPSGNAACVLGSLGWRTGYIARLGDDTISRVARSELTRCGVSDELVIADPEASAGVAVVEIDPATGDRTVFYNLSRYRFVRSADISADTVKSVKLILVDGYEAEAALAMLEIARDAGVSSVLDLEAGDPAVLRRMLELGSHAILPLATASRLTNESEPAAALRQLGRWTDAQLVVTDGRHGAWALTPGGVIHQPIFPVETVDTTGCGDAFHGAYASALLDGWALPLRLEFASLLASRVAMAMGGRTNLPTRESLRAGDLSALSPELREKLSL